MQILDNICMTVKPHKFGMISFESPVSSLFVHVKILLHVLETHYILLPLGGTIRLPIRQCSRGERVGVGGRREAHTYLTLRQSYNLLIVWEPPLLLSFNRFVRGKAGACC